MNNNDQIKELTLSYFNGNQMLTDIWLSKYVLKDREGKYLEDTPDQRFKTIAKEVARVESNAKYTEDDFYGLLKDFGYFIPGGSILYGIGNTYYATSLGNCFVIGNKVDSYGSICTTDQEQIQLMKRRGGVGHDLSHLRPKGAGVNGCASTSTGAFSFMERYSNSTREVAQEGRRGALMLTAHINHPDIEDFIQAKDDLSKITGANISVKVTDEFMQAVESNSDYILRFPIDANIDSINIEELEYNLTTVKNLKDDSKIYVKRVKAKELWSKIVHQAWKNGEPGVLYWDTILRESPADCYKDHGFSTISTNPCGEITLSPYSSCILGHHNLYSYIENGEFNTSKFVKNIHLATRLMDNIITLESEKIKHIISLVETSYEDEFIKATELRLWNKVLTQLLKGRRIGIGIVGLADTVASLGMRYSSEEANAFCIKIQKLLAIETYKASIELAKEKGCFPIWNESCEQNNVFLNRIKKHLSEQDLENYRNYGRRNIGCLTIAPTGTISQFANKIGVSSGMEPVFETFYQRRRKINSNDAIQKVDYIDAQGDKWQWYNIIHPIFLKWIREVEKDETPVDLFTQDRLKELHAKSPYNLSTANEIDTMSKVRLQGGLQEYVDHSISVTHNLPNSTTEEQVNDLYLSAWKNKCKGVTIFRDGSRQGVLVRDKSQFENHFDYKDAQKRPEILDCEIHSLTALKEKWYIIVGLLENKPYEIFAVKKDKLSKIRSNENLLKGKIVKRKKKVYDLIVSTNDKLEVIKDIVSLMENDDDRSDTKQFSLELRHRINPKYIVETINKQPKDITSFEKAIARVLKKYIPDGERSGEVCPYCGGTMIYTGGCAICKDCGQSRCS